MGTRPEPIGICVATAEAADEAVPRFDRYGGPSRQSGSESRPSPIQRRATTSERDALKGENPGSLRGVQVKEVCATPADAFRIGSGSCFPQFHLIFDSSSRCLTPAPGLLS
jgi:hypothetical protein